MKKLFKKRMLPAVLAVTMLASVISVPAKKTFAYSYTELAAYWAPQVYQAVNSSISDGGRGDLFTNFDYDGDWAGNNNWDNVMKYSQPAYVYYSVQETSTHYFIGYYFYHPKDDSEVSLDRHENDMEGAMFVIKKNGSYGTFQLMYSQAHGGCLKYWNDTAITAVKCKKENGVQFSGTRPMIYIEPNGTLSNAGHGVESYMGHSTYSGINSGILYNYTGTAQVPTSWKNGYVSCGYALKSLDELWSRRNGPYGSGQTFGDFTSFDGDNYGEDKANPPWAWHDDTAYTFSGDWLTDPAWLVDTNVDGLGTFSHTYISNPYYTHKVTLNGITAVKDYDSTANSSDCYVRLYVNGSQYIGHEWWTKMDCVKDTFLPIASFGEAGQKFVYNLGENTNSIYIAAPSNATFQFTVMDWDEGETDDDMGSIKNIVPAAGSTYTLKDVLTDKSAAKVSASITNKK